jgi:hypothetical protein
VGASEIIRPMTSENVAAVPPGLPGVTLPKGVGEAWPS